MYVPHMRRQHSDRTAFDCLSIPSALACCAALAAFLLHPTGSEYVWFTVDCDSKMQWQRRTVQEGRIHISHSKCVCTFE